MYSMVRIVNKTVTVAHLKVARGADLKSSHPKKKKL